MKKKVLAFLLASTMVIEPFSVAGAADFSDGTGQASDMQFSDDAEDVPEVETNDVDQFSTDAAGEGENSSKPSEDAIQMGNDVWFTFDEATGTATISGTGDMWDYIEDGSTLDGEENPLRDMYIDTLIIGDNITHISDYLLYKEEKNYIYSHEVKKIQIGKKVKSIGKYAFHYEPLLDNVIFTGKNVLELGSGCFYKCIGLKNIELPDSINKLGMYCFEDCINLENIKLSNSLVEIPANCFWDCTSLKEINIPDSINNINDGAFWGCKSLKNVEFGPNTKITKINSSVFRECAKLEKIDLPDSLEEIGVQAFEGCSRLNNVILPSKVKIISTSAFAGCINLSNIILNEGLERIGSGSFLGCIRLQEISIPQSVTYINYSYDEEDKKYWHPFIGCNSLTKIKGYICPTVKKFYDWLPEDQRNKITFESLGEGNHQLTSEKVQIKNPTCTEKGIKAYRCEICGVTKDEEEVPALGHDWNEGVVTKKATETEEGERTYTCRRCNETKTESIPKIPKQEDKLKITGQGMKWLDHNSVELKFQSNVKGTYYIKTVKRGEKAPKIDITQAETPVEANTTVTAEVTDLPEYDVDIYVCIVSESDKSNYSATVFQPISSERPSKVVDTVKVGDNAVATINGDTLTITGSGTTYDESGCFHEVNKSQIKHIVVSDGITYLGDSLFFQFGMVEDVELPTSLNGIGYSAFANCTALTNLTLPDSIITIRGEAFSNCSTLDKITLPSKLTSLGYDVFEGCNAEIIFPSSLKCIPELGNNAVKKVEIPEGVEIIEEEAFWGCSNLIKITLPSTITSIGKGAFLGTGITSFNYPQNITNIPNIAFQNTNLKEFSVPEKVTEIGDSAFYDCADLEKITIPKSVTYIGTGAFAKCRNLTIYGFKDSAAEAYAKANTIKFVSADYKVIFKDNGRTKKTEYVTKGQNATPPTLDAKAGYTLSWDADYTNITEDMVINAVWTKKDSGSSGGGTTIIVTPSESTKYTVTFKDRGEVVKTEKVKSGDAAEYPFITRNGYKLSWDKDFSKITANITVNAVWTVIKPAKATSLVAEADKKSIALSWDETEYTSYYLVYRKADGETEYIQVAKTTKVLWTDSKAVPGTQYSYKVVAVRSLEGKKYQGAESDVVTTKIGTPQIGDTYSVGDLNYKLTGTKEVTVTGLAKVTDTLVIPSSVTISGKVYKVTAIQDKAFYRNEDIVNVTIGNNVVNVGKYAFYQCSGLETVKFGKRVAIINTCAFTQCPNLENVTLPSSIRKIGAKAFYQCTSIKIFKINGSVLEYVGKKGLAVNKSVTLKLPKKVYTRYKKLIKASNIYSKTKFTKF